MSKTTSVSNVQSKKTTCYMNRSQQTKAWNDSTKCIEQKSLTEHDQKGTKDMMAPMKRQQVLFTVSDLAENRAWHKQNYEGIFASSNDSPQYIA